MTSKQFIRLSLNNKEGTSIWFKIDKIVATCQLNDKATEVFTDGCEEPFCVKENPNDIVQLIERASQ